jgi:hypothetical protein
VTLELLGVQIHEADVALTDLGLTLLGGGIAWRLWTRADRNSVQRDGALFMAGLALAALAGALFHAFFPLTTSTRAGVVMWMPVVVSIALTSAAMLALACRLLVPALGTTVRRLAVGVYAAAFVGWALLVDESYATIVRFYGPALLALLVASLVMTQRLRSAAWRAVAAGLGLSVLAAILQQARVALHPVYFNHNAVYHVLQGVALVLIYRGLSRVREVPVGE